MHEQDVWKSRVEAEGLVGVAEQWVGTLAATAGSTSLRSSE
jgi:hypothetical protein